MQFQVEDGTNDVGHEPALFLEDELLRDARSRCPGCGPTCGGVMIGTVTALTILSRAAAQPLVSQIVYVLGPSLIGFLGYTVTLRNLRSLLRNSPAVEQLIQRRIAAFRIDLARVTTTRLEQSARRTRILQFIFPFACISLYLLWTASGIHRQAIQQLIVPATIREWLIILPYVLLVPALLLRDPIQLAVLRRRLRNTA